MMYRYYIERGHDIHNLLQLSPTEKYFYKLHQQLTEEELEAVKNG